MRISFDIDDTLVCETSVPTEQCVAWWRRWRYPERLRRGTRSLMTALMQRRCKIWIYTSSGRSSHYLKSWFASFGIPIEGVVNQNLHEQRIGVRGPSKFPPAFGIDLHVDDSPGVAMEGEDHRFAVLVVKPSDPDWARRVLNAVDTHLRVNPDKSEQKLAPNPAFAVTQKIWNYLACVAWSEQRIPAYAVGDAKSDPV